MTKQDVIQTAEAKQVPMYKPTQAEIRAAIMDEFCRDAECGETPPLPVRAYRLVEQALTRANKGEFRA